MAYDTTFVGTTDGLTADNLLKPAKGEVMLLSRDDKNFEASQSTIDNNSLYDLGVKGAVSDVSAKPYIIN